MMILCESGLSTFGQGDTRLELSCPQGYHMIATSFQHCITVVYTVLGPMVRYYALGYGFHTFPNLLKSYRQTLHY